MATKNSRAMSPIIGSVLLLGITVALASIVAVAALGIGLPAAPTFATDSPEATFDTQQVRGATLVTHAGGDSLAGDQLVLETGSEVLEWGGETVSEGDSTTVAGDVRAVVWTGDGERVDLERFEE